MKREVIHIEESFPAGAADLIEQSAVESIAAHGRFRLALPGGKSPQPVFAELAARPIPWEHVWITFGDERCVPPDNPESNYGMAREHLLSKIRIPAERVLRMKGEAPPERAAREYERALAGLAAESGEARFVHDLLLLGLGDDGHTASLFPGTPALEEKERGVVENHVAKLRAHRITFTLPLINAARRVMFLVSDRTKRPVVEEILRGDSEHPAARVAPDEGQVVWVLGWGNGGATG